MTAERPTPSPEHDEASDFDRKLDRLEEEFAALAGTIRQRMRSRASAIDPSLAPAGYRVLMAIAQVGETSPTELADALGFDRSVLSRQLHQLEDLQLVSRRPDPNDRRAVVVRLTPAAMTRIEAAKSLDRDLFRSRLGSWPSQDLDHLIRLLGRLTENGSPA